MIFSIDLILFASKEPVKIQDFLNRMPHGCEPILALNNLKVFYQTRGVNLKKIGDAWAIRTAPDLGFLMQSESVEMRKLSRAAVETLSIIAYHQPVSRAEIEEIRGVSVSKGTLDLLMEMDWVCLGRRRTTPGRPITFTITQNFLDHFGLGSLKDLPGIKELRAAGLLENRPAPGVLIDNESDTRNCRNCDSTPTAECSLRYKMTMIRGTHQLRTLGSQCLVQMESMRPCLPKHRRWQAVRNLCPVVELHP